MVNSDQIGRYRLEGLLGKGGMGEVYRAYDGDLDRSVALKILPRELALDPERFTRFEREARATARINHPGVVTVHEFGTDGRVHFLIMELVDGRPIHQFVDESRPDLAGLLELGSQLADAVAAAHTAGITHRDLKPANVLVTPEGRVKVLDFGLAKPTEAQAEPEVDSLSDSSLPTAMELTDPGRLLGTVAYMSPEQAEGKAIDHRSDIFSLGVVLYELFTGRRPFAGDSAASVLSAVLRDDPPSVDEVKPGLPVRLGRIVRRCLHKEIDRRYQSALDIRNELEILHEETISGEISASATAAAPPRRWLWALPVATVALAVVAIAAWPRAGDETSPRTSVVPADGAPRVAQLRRLTTHPDDDLFPSLSRDGTTLIHASRQSGGNADIFRLRVGGENAINLTQRPDADDSQPALSPDGDLVVFRSSRDGGGLFLMGSTGESVRRLTDTGFNPAWSPDGAQVAFGTRAILEPRHAPDSELWVVDLASGALRRVAEADAAQPSWSPNGHRIAFLSQREGTAQLDLVTVAAGGGDRRPVTDDIHVDWCPTWSPDGAHLYFSSDRSGALSVWRVAIDELSGEVLSAPEAVTTATGVIHAHLSISGDGRRLASAVSASRRNLARIQLDAGAERVSGAAAAITTGQADWRSPVVSPDGEWLAFLSENPADIYVSRVDGSERRQLTDDPHRDLAPRWSPDGAQIAFRSNRGGSYEIWAIRADGSGLRQLTNSGGKGSGRPVWSPDGRRIAFQDLERRQNRILDLRDLSLSELPADGDGPVIHINSWSRDGRRIAGHFASRRTETRGSHGLHVLDLESGRWRQIGSTGLWPVWMSDGRRLLYQDAATGASLEAGAIVARDQVFLVDVESGRKRALFSLSRPDRVRDIALAPDDRSIIYSYSRREVDIWMFDLE